MTLPDPLSETAARTFRALLERGSATRPELSALLGVTKQTVSIAVVELESRDLVEAVSVQQGRVGRSALRYALHRRAGWVAGIDLASADLRVVAARLDGTVVAERIVHNPAPTVIRDPAAQLDLAAHALADTATQLTEAEGGLLGAAIAVPRPVGTVRDIVGTAAGEDEERLLAALAPVSPAAIWTENDVNCGALAQLAEGDARRTDLLYLRAGLGVGAALVCGGRLIRGIHGRAGEVRDLSWPSSSAGTVEQRLNAEALLAAAGHSTSASLFDALDDLFAAAALGDPAAESAVDVEAAGLAELVALLSAVTDPGLVVLSGELGARADLAHRVADGCLHAGVAAEVVPDPTGGWAPARGAASLAAGQVRDAIAPAARLHLAAHQAVEAIADVEA